MLTAVSGFVVCATLAAEPMALLDPTELPIHFQRYRVADRFGRTITFYLSREPAMAAKLPIVLWIQGSGCQSLFREQNGQVTGGHQNLLLQAAGGRARIMAVEKPGVAYLDTVQRPGSAIGASEEFRREHTLERWAEANVAALRAVQSLPNIDPERCLVIGHSEGGIVAAMVGRLLPSVTHLASLAGGGPTQLFDLRTLQRQARPDDQPGDADRRVQKFDEGWRRVQQDPQSTATDWLGHPHRRWSSFLTHSVRDELLQTKALIFLAQGTADTAVSVTGFDMLVAELQVHGKDVTAERLFDADHGFRRPEDASPTAGIRALFDRVLTWFWSTMP